MDDEATTSGGPEPFLGFLFDYIHPEDLSTLASIGGAIGLPSAILGGLAFLTRALWLPLLRRKPSEAELTPTSETLDPPDRTEPSFPQKPAAELPPNVLPRRAIVGRDDDLARLTQALGAPPSAGRPPAVALIGAGGRGKTTLAREFISRSLRRYEQIAWVRCQSVEADLAALAPRLGFAPAPGTPEQIVAQQVVGLLGQAEARWLVVYDNAGRPAEVEPWRPEIGHLHILVTAREGGWPATHYVEQPLDVLAPEAAAALLLAEAAPGDGAEAAEGRDEAAATALAETLGRLPLALVMAGAWLRDTPSTPFAEYSTRIDDILHGRTPEDYPVPENVAPSLAAAVGLSLDRCDEAETALLNVFAWMAPEGLGADLLAPAAALREGSGWLPDIPEPLLRLAQDGAAAEAAVARLARRSLLTPAAEGGGHALHRLTALVLRTRQGDDRDGARAAAAILAAAYPYDSDIHTEWPACARLTPHFLALHDAAGDAPPPTAAMGWLCSQASLYLQVQADRPAARALAETGLTLKRARLGDDHRETGAGHTALGGILNDMGDPAAARPHYEEALRISRALGDAAAADLPIDLNNLAVVLEYLAAEARAGDRTQEVAVLVREAQALYRQALALARAAVAQAEAAGDARAATAASIPESNRLNNLSSLNSAAGHKRRALVLAHHAVQRWPDAASPEDPRLASYLNTLGALHLQLRDPDSAVAPLRRALDIREKHLPEGHPDRRGAAEWLVACLLALDPPQTDAARDLAARYGLDFDAYKRQAETQFRAP
ncbi:MAG: tetratricopeptide repeat protein [Pseudomonadota bacterium]